MSEARGGPAGHWPALLDAARSVAAHGDLPSLLADLAGRLPAVVPFDFLAILLHDPAADAMRRYLMAARSPEETPAAPELTPLASPGGQVWRTQEPVLIPDLTLETRFPEMPDIWRAYDMRSGCYLPLTTPRRRLGTLLFASHSPHAYAPADLDFLGEVSRFAAVAVENALFAAELLDARRQLEAERDQLRLLLDLNNALVTQLDLRDLFRAAAGVLGRFIRHDYATLVLLEPGRPELRVHTLVFPAGKGLLRQDRVVPLDPSPAGIAIRAGRARVFDRADLVRIDSQITRLLLEEGIHALCSVPLTARGQQLGALNVGRLDGGADFAPEEVDLLTRAAGQIALAVDNALAYGQIAALRDRLAEEKLYLEDEIRTEHGFGEIVGQSPALLEVLRQVRVVAPTDAAVLVLGETGTGKELVARAVHRLSRRAGRTFVKLNCAAIPTGLLESELFGHERGAFTGAVARKVGRFELADGGTLFLDEVGEISPELQPKLLRVLQEQEFERLGGVQTHRVDVRLVAATNRDLAGMVAEGRFRADLFYRLNVFPLTLPPLRERREDIPLLVRHFVRERVRKLNRQVEHVPAAVMDALVSYPWPGNVRELDNFIERSVLLSAGRSLAAPVADLRAAPVPAAAASEPLEAAERRHILAALEQAGWVIGGPNGAAARLGLKRTTLQSRMAKLGIHKPR